MALIDDIKAALTAPGVLVEIVGGLSVPERVGIANAMYPFNAYDRDIAAKRAQVDQSIWRVNRLMDTAKSLIDARDPAAHVPSDDEILAAFKGE